MDLGRLGLPEILLAFAFALVYAAPFVAAAYVLFTVRRTWMLLQQMADRLNSIEERLSNRSTPGPSGPTV